MEFPTPKEIERNNQEIGTIPTNVQIDFIHYMENFVQQGIVDDWSAYQSASRLIII